MKIITSAVIVTAFLLTALCAVDGAYAQQGKGYERRGDRPDGYGLYRGCPLNLKLEPGQAAKMQAMRNAFFKDTIELRTDIFKHEQKLDAVMLEPDLDVKKAKKIQATISDLRAQFARKRLQAQIDARKILTPKQIAQLPPGCTMGIGPDEAPGTRGKGGNGKWR